MLLRRVIVQGRSMEPSFAEGERLWAESVTYRFRPPRRGEVVLVDHPNQPFRMVKRVTGVPGDVAGERRLGPDEYFVTGDNPIQSTDSRSYGSFPRSAIRARILAPRTS